MWLHIVPLVHDISLQLVKHVGLLALSRADDWCVSREATRWPRPCDVAREIVID